jgi:hypothetical protein
MKATCTTVKNFSANEDGSVASDGARAFGSLMLIIIVALVLFYTLESSLINHIFDLLTKSMPSLPR